MNKLKIFKEDKTDKNDTDILGINTKEKVNDDEKDEKHEEVDLYVNKVWWNKEQNITEREKLNKKESIILEKPEITSLLPRGRKETDNKETPDKLGVADSKFGAVEVGYKKYKPNSKLSFSFIPDIDKEANNIKEENPYGIHEYFGENYSRKEKKFQESDMTFMYDPQKEEIQKKDARGNHEKADEDEDLIYKNDMEDEKLKQLQEVKRVTDEKEGIDSHIRFNEKVKDTKKEENQKFVEEVKTFIKALKKGKINKISDSDDVIQMLKRIREKEWKRYFFSFAS